MESTTEEEYKAPPKLVIEMLPTEESVSIFERIKNSFPSVKRKSSDGSSSTQSDVADRRDSIKSAISLSSIEHLDLSNRRASSASTFGSWKIILENFTDLYNWISGNHGTYGPLLSAASDQLLEPRKDKCPLTRCLSAREARMIKRSKSVKTIDIQPLSRSQHTIS